MTLDEKMDKQDSNIKKMARVLREGAKMLDIACPECNNPLFQYKSGEMACVACAKKVVFERDVIGKSATPATSGFLAKKHEPLPVTSIPQLKNGAGKPMPFLLVELKSTCSERISLLVDEMKKPLTEEQAALVYGNLLKLLEILKELRFF
jgi:ribosomal protein S27E